LQVQSLPTWDPQRWRREAALRATLRGRYHGVCADVQELSDRVVRASSLVENLNSRLRSYPMFGVARPLARRKSLFSGLPDRVGPKLVVTIYPGFPQDFPKITLDSP
jgi:hypothetical protein